MGSMVYSFLMGHAGFRSSKRTGLVQSSWPFCEDVRTESARFQLEVWLQSETRRVGKGKTVAV